jgi:hypothetical protein
MCLQHIDPYVWPFTSQNLNTEANEFTIGSITYIHNSVKVLFLRFQWQLGGLVLYVLFSQKRENLFTLGSASGTTFSDQVFLPVFQVLEFGAAPDHLYHLKIIINH